MNPYPANSLHDVEVTEYDLFVVSKSMSMKGVFLHGFRFADIDELTVDQTSIDTGDNIDESGISGSSDIDYSF
jgi:hypothetical protein